MSDTPLTDAAISRRTGYAGYGHIDIGDCRNIERELREDIEALRAENERLRKDAERYRFILLSSSGLDVFVAAYHNTNLINEIDAAIDAAIAAKEAS